MNEREVWVPLAGPPQVAPPSPNIYPAMKEEGIFALLEDFYRRLAKSSIAHLFAKEEEALIYASKKSACFFVGLCGGPPLFHQNFGPPRLRARHIPFPITMADKDVWLECFYASLDSTAQELHFPMEEMAGFKEFLSEFSVWMVNKKL